MLRFLFCFENAFWGQVLLLQICLGETHTSLHAKVLLESVIVKNHGKEDEPLNETGCMRVCMYIPISVYICLYMYLCQYGCMCMYRCQYGWCVCTDVSMGVWECTYVGMGVCICTYYVGLKVPSMIAIFSDRFSEWLGLNPQPLPNVILTFIFALTIWSTIFVYLNGPTRPLFHLFSDF